MLHNQRRGFCQDKTDLVLPCGRQAGCYATKTAQERAQIVHQGLKMPQIKKLIELEAMWRGLLCLKYCLSVFTGQSASIWTRVPGFSTTTLYCSHDQSHVSGFNVVADECMEGAACLHYHLSFQWCFLIFSFIHQKRCVNNTSSRIPVVWHFWKYSHWKHVRVQMSSCQDCSIIPWCKDVLALRCWHLSFKLLKLYWKKSFAGLLSSHQMLQTCLKIRIQ